MDLIALPRRPRTRDRDAFDPFNPQGNLLPIANAISFSWTAGVQWAAIPVPTVTLNFPDSSTLSIAPPAAPGTPVLSQGAGTLAAATYFVRTAYVKNGFIVAVSAEASIAIAANTGVTIASPAKPSYAVDGWIPLFGTATNAEQVNSAYTTGPGSSLGSLVAIGTSVTVGSTAGLLANLTYNSAWLNALVCMLLSALTTYYVYPYWDLTAGGVMASGQLSGATGNLAVATSAPAAAAQYGDGRVALTNGNFTVTTTNSGTGGGSGGSGRYK